MGDDQAATRMLRTGKPYKIDFPALREAASPLPVPVRPWFQFSLPYGFHYRTADVTLQDLPPSLAGFRILHLTDSHLKHHWGKPYDRLLERLAQSPPDLILFTGDFIDNKCDHRPALPIVQRLVKGLVAAAPTYAILGNHDPDVLQHHVAELGVTFVGHRRMLIPARDKQLELIGLTGTARQQLDMDFVRALPPRQPGVPRIVLCHYPDLFPSTLALDPDLYLSGHTHGGQICLPTGDALLTHDRMPRRFAKGLHHVGACWYHVSHGFGFTGLPFRVFCPAETMELVMRFSPST